MTALRKRSCGDCNVCCVALKIELPELPKEAGTPCPHLAGKGCGIYASRPTLCQQFLCGWRLFEDMDDDWRPDRSGVLAMQKGQDQLPLAWRKAPYGVLLVITGGEDAIRRPALAEYVARLIARRIPVYLSPGVPVTFVNERLDGSEDVAALRQRLLELYALLQGGRWSIFRKIAYLYRLQVERSKNLLSKSKA
jgi:hypothetical protein